MIADHPVFGLALTVIAYYTAGRLQKRYPHPLVNPLLIASAAIVVVLMTLGIEYETYNQGGRLLSFWLGPATVALAIPLSRQIRPNRGGIPLALAIVAIGSTVAVISAAYLAVALGASSLVTRSLIPKSVTTPIAIELAHLVGGTPSLTAVFVVLTGLLGNLIGPELLRVAGVRNPQAVGLALGTASHGIGTARALHEGPEQAGSSSLAMGWAGIWTAILIAVAHAIGWV